MVVIASIKFEDKGRDEGLTYLGKTICVSKLD